MWKLPLDGRALATVAEYRLSCQDHGYKFGGYFNSGIMLVDLYKWRQSDLLERGRRFAIEHPNRLRHWDQDVLNHIFEADWLQLPDRWNACPHLKGKYLEAKVKTPWATTPLEDVPPHPWQIAINKAVFQAKCLVRRNFIGEG